MGSELDGSYNSLQLENVVLIDVPSLDGCDEIAVKINKDVLQNYYTSSSFCFSLCFEDTYCCQLCVKNGYITIQFLGLKCMITRNENPYLFVFSEGIVRWLYDIVEFNSKITLATLIERILFLITRVTREEEKAIIPAASIKSHQKADDFNALCVFTEQNDENDLYVRKKTDSTDDSLNIDNLEKERAYVRSLTGNTTLILFLFIVLVSLFLYVQGLRDCVTCGDLALDNVQ